jgi:hypothetical protein
VIGVECDGQSPSGFDENALLDAAIETHDKMEKKLSKWRKCLKTLWKIPKFNPLVNVASKKRGADADDDPSTTATTTNSTSVMGSKSNLDRPLGQKKARRQQLL